jgi:hypothetical protein
VRGLGPGRLVEGLPAGNAAGTLGSISSRFQTLDSHTDIGGSLDDNVNVEHRFGSQTGYRSTANVLDLNRDATQCGS